jgi:hypothetical protein
VVYTNYNINGFVPYLFYIDIPVIYHDYSMIFNGYSWYITGISIKKRYRTNHLYFSWYIPHICIRSTYGCDIHGIYHVYTMYIYASLRYTRYIPCNGMHIHNIYSYKSFCLYMTHTIHIHDIYMTYTIQIHNIYITYTIHMYVCYTYKIAGKCSAWQARHINSSSTTSVI